MENGVAGLNDLVRNGEIGADENVHVAVVRNLCHAENMRLLGFGVKQNNRTAWRLRDGVSLWRVAVIAHVNRAPQSQHGLNPVWQFHDVNFHAVFRGVETQTHDFIFVEPGDQLVAQSFAFRFCISIVIEVRFYWGDMALGVHVRDYFARRKYCQVTAAAKSRQTTLHCQNIGSSGRLCAS